MTQFEKFQEVLREMGVDFQLTDDSEEADRTNGEIDWDAPIIDTVVVIDDKESVGCHPCMFLFRRDGSFKEVVVF